MAQKSSNYFKQPDYSEPFGFLTPNSTQLGVSSGYAENVGFDEASKYIDPNLESLEMFSTFPMTRIIPGGVYLFGDGTVSAPAVGFLSDSDTGFYHPAAGQIGVTINGVQEALFTSSGLTIPDLTPGQVVFPGTGGLLSGSSSFFWDNANSRLGLGGAPANSDRLDITDTALPTSVSFGVYLNFISSATAAGHQDAIAVQMYADPAADAATGCIGTSTFSYIKSGNTHNFSGETIGLVSSSRHYGTGTSAIHEGIKIHTYSAATGTVTTLYGLKSQFGAFHDSAPYTLSNSIVGAGYGIYSQIIFDNASTATTLHCFHSDPTGIATSGTITTVVGMYLDSITLTGGGAVTNKYGLYQVGTGDQNYFAGPVGFNVLPTSGYQLQIKPPNANGILLDRTASGQFDVDFADNGSIKWQLVKTTTNDFRIYDTVAALDAIRFQTGPILGIGTATPRRTMDILKADGNPQFRLTYTDNTVYTDLQTDSSGVLSFQPTGNISEQRNGTNAQLHYIYNTFTSSTSFERLEIGANAGGVGANTFGIMSKAGSGGGTTRGLILGTAGANNLAFRANGITYWVLSNSTGAFFSNTDNGADLGASSNRAKTGYFGTSLKVQGGNVQNTSIEYVTELTTIAAAATTDTAIQIPVDAVVLGVSVRVTTAIPTAATFTVTGTTSGTQFDVAGGVAVAANTTDTGTRNCPYKNGAAQTIRITPNINPAANTGRVRVTIHYYVINPPTS
jgi:hypothetical protein